MSTTTITAGVANSNTIVIMNGGAISAGGPVTVAPGKDYIGFDGAGQPYVKEADKASYGVAEVNAAGDFDVDGVDRPVVKGGDIVTDLAGVSYDGLKGGGNNITRRPIHYSESRKTVHIVSWNYATGEPTYDSPAVTTDSFGTDDAARPTRAIPGEFVYKGGSNTPVNANYGAKTGG